LHRYEHKERRAAAAFVRFDGSLIKADASRQNGVKGSAGLPSKAASRAVQEYLTMLDDAAFGAVTPVAPKFLSGGLPGVVT
jgi:hypothetical protein